MIKKIIKYISLAFLVLIDIFLIANINSYCLILEHCFNRTVRLTTKSFILISIIIAITSVLIYIAILLALFRNKEAQKGIKLKSEDGTYGTSNWLDDNEAKTILGLNNEAGILLGKKDNKNVILPFDSFLNKNILVIGSSR